MADLKISQLTAKGTAIAATDLVEISESDGAGGYVTKSVTGANIIGSKQDTLISGTNIKTVNSTTLLGSGNLAVQPTLVSGTNIKTINSNSILGSGDLVITGGVTAVSATTPIVATGTTTPVISLAASYGDTQNPYASKTANNILAAPNGTSGVPTFRAIVGADIPTLNQNTTGTAANVTGIVALANGGTGTATPSLVAGTNVTITGTFPNQTIASSGGGGGTEIGALIGGGVVVAVYNENGVNKALVASLTNLGNVPYTVPAFQSTLIGATAQSFFNGLTNTNAIIAQTGASATTAYAAGLARLFAGGGFSDWYLPALYELHILFNSAALTSRVTGVTAFDAGFNYFSSTEQTATQCYALSFATGNTTTGYGKSFGGLVRAVRIHTI